MNNERIKKLHTDELEAVYGPVHVEVLSQDFVRRVIDINDEMGITRCHAITWWSHFEETDVAISPVVKAVVEGGSMGKMFRQYGWDIEKPEAANGNVLIPKWLKLKFRSDLDMAQTNIYWFVAVRGNDDRHTVGLIAEIDSPLFFRPDRFVKSWNIDKEQTGLVSQRIRELEAYLQN